MAQSVKCFPHKYRDMGLIHKTMSKKAGVVVHAWTLITGEVEGDRFLAFWLASPA